jgi:TolA-binding protein
MGRGRMPGSGEPLAVARCAPGNETCAVIHESFPGRRRQRRTACMFFRVHSSASMLGLVLFVGFTVMSTTTPVVLGATPLRAPSSEALSRTLWPSGGTSPEPAEWRSWRQNVAESKGEVKRLRQVMMQAEQTVEMLSDRLVDAKQAQERANLALKDKDDRLAAVTRELDAAKAQISKSNSEHAGLVQQLCNQLDQMREQEETLTQRVMELQGQLHESEDRRELAERRLEEEQLLMENFRSEFEANHIIEATLSRLACGEKRGMNDGNERAETERPNSAKRGSLPCNLTRSK